MMNMVTFLIAYPDASLDEIAVFIYNEGGSLLPPCNIQLPSVGVTTIKKITS